MKKICLLLFAIVTLFSCLKDEKAIFISKNYFEEFQTEKVQLFDLDTLSFKEIIGRLGTKIYFNRRNFNVSKNDKITLELIELYDFKEILYRNINTVTVNGDLLETNGVLYISFKSNGKEIKLKNYESLPIYPPGKKLINYDIFKAKMDSLKTIKWEILKQTDTIFPIYKGGGIWVSTRIKKDSVDFYKKQNEKLSKFTNYNHFTKSKYPDFFLLKNDDFGYINIDKLVGISSKISFKLIDRKKEYSGFNIYFTYKNLKSFISYARSKDSLEFENIAINDETWITIIGEKEDGLYYDKIQLNKDVNNSDMILKMRKINKENLKAIIY